MVSTSGQTNVQFTGIYPKKSRKNVDWNLVCLFISASKNPVNQDAIKNHFGMSQAQFYKGVQRRKCIKRLDAGVYVHDDLLHSIGQNGKGVVAQNVHSILPSWFDVSTVGFEWEIHGEKRESPKNVQVCPLNISVEKSYDWIYCNVWLKIKDGKIEIQMQPKSSGHKYGLNQSRYGFYLTYISKLLSVHLGFVPLNLLAVTRFDLQWDSYVEEYDDAYRIAEIYNFLRLQEYPILRGDKKVNRRREVCFLNPTGVEYATETQAVLSVSAELLHDLKETKELKKSLSVASHQFSGAAQTVLYNMNEQVKANETVNQLILKNQNIIHSKISASESNLNAAINIQSAKLEKLDILSRYQLEELDILSRTSENQLSALETMVKQNDTAIHQRDLQQDLHRETNTRLGVIIHQNESIQDLLVSIHEELRQHKESVSEWKEINRQAKLDILSRLSKIGTWRDIAEIIQKEFSVTHQALNQFWNYWTKNVHGHLVKKPGNENVQNEFISRGNGRVSVVKKHEDSVKKKSISVEFWDKIHTLYLTSPGIQYSKNTLAKLIGGDRNKTLKLISAAVAAGYLTQRSDPTHKQRQLFSLKGGNSNGK